MARQGGSRRRSAAFASPPATPTPRKLPVQDRSRTTVDAILTATFQVLDRHGADGLTTTRVAEVAGVSVGTLYQYFPNKQALIAGLLAEHLAIAIAALDRIATEVAASPIEIQVDRLVRGFVAVKAERAAISRAMQPALAAIDDRPIVRAATRRAALIVARLLTGGTTPDPATVRHAGVLCAALEGTIAAAIAEDPARLSDPVFVDQLVALAHGGVSAGR